MPSLSPVSRGTSGSGGVKGRAVGSKVSLPSSSAASHVLVACSSGSPQRPTSGLDTGAAWLAAVLVACSSGSPQRSTSGLDAGAAWLAADTPGDLKVFSRPKVSSADRSTAESDPKVSSQ